MRTSLLSATNSAHLLALGAEARVEKLKSFEHNEVLAFLKRRPLHTAYLAGLIRDHGLENAANRGIFYGCRNYLGQLEGVALIGHAILMETVSDFALRAFAKKAQSCRDAHLIMCEESVIDKFWGYYAGAGQEMRRACRELLFELRWPIEVSKHESQLRLATAADLNALIPVHAELAFAESGVDPRLKDESGFIARYQRRIEQGRTWILTDHQKLIFKADVVSETPDSAYVEGVWVNPDVRRQGHGRACMAQLARMLLWRSKSICLFVNDENEDARLFYRKAGYHHRTIYDTIFLG